MKAKEGRGGDANVEEAQLSRSASIMLLSKRGVELLEGIGRGRQMDRMADAAIPKPYWCELKDQTVAGLDELSASRFQSVHGNSIGMSIGVTVRMTTALGTLAALMSEEARSCTFRHLIAQCQNSMVQGQGHRLLGV